MRIKTLLAAAVAVAALPAMAADVPVYSQNVVGYVKLPIHEGYNLIANHLDLDLTGTNNTISGVFGTNLPLNSVVYTWSGSTYNPAASFAKNKSGVPTWSAAASQKLNPGMAAWVSVQTGALGGTTQDVVTVGNVLQGSLVNPNMKPGGGYTLISSMVPLTGGLQTTLKYTPQVGDLIYTHNGTTYNPAFSYIKNKSGVNVWSPSEPSISVGQSFWLSTTAANVWSNNFTVQ